MNKTLCLLAVMALGCSHRETRAAPESRATPSLATAAATEGSPRSPLGAEWILKGATGNRTVLVARIVRHAPIPVPIQVTVTLPAGARLITGATQFTIPASDSASVHEQELTIETAGQPATDALLEADASGPGFGIHVKQAYGFGRSRKPEPLPTPEGPSIKLGTHDIGPAIPGK